MAILTRLSRLFRADFHALLDQLEAPDVLLKQSLRDMEEQLGIVEQNIGRCQKQRRQLAEQCRENEALIAVCDEDIDVCFRSEDDILARAAVKRKVMAELQLKQLKTQVDALDMMLTDLQKRQQKNQKLYEAVRQKADMLTMEPESKKAFGPLVAEVDLPIQHDMIELAFLKERKRFETKIEQRHEV